MMTLWPGQDGYDCVDGFPVLTGEIKLIAVVFRRMSGRRTNPASAKPDPA
jgi:hypothetical protein